MKRKQQNAMDEDFGDDYVQNDDNAMEEINVDLFLENQSENDYLDVKNFLIHSAFKYFNMNLTTLTNVLLSTQIGSVIKTSDTETYGFAIPIELNALIQNGLMDSFNQYVISAFNTYNPNASTLVTNVLNGSMGRTMLILNERMINCPTDILSLLHNTIYEEIDIYDKEKSITTKPTYFIVVGSCVKDVDNGQDNDNEEQTVRRKKKSQVSTELEYILLENQIYSRYSDAIATVPVSTKNRWTLSGNVHDYVSIMLISNNKVPLILKEIADAFGSSNYVEQK
ncbi:Protein BCP1 [Entamoeba marina]